MLYRITLILSVIILVGCNTPTVENLEVDLTTRFTLLASDQTHITFNNQLTEGLNTNVLMYEYFYNGGGVAIGDINNDGLDDIYFSGNMTENKLYLNKSNMQFEDITLSAGVAGREGPWATGVTMVDINGDGLLDIFQSYSGKINGIKRIKQLFVNKGSRSNGEPYFEEEAEKFGLADSSFTTQTVFFDYDRDNDLDALFINHNPNRINILDDNFIAQLQKQTHPTIGVKLFQNSNGHFEDITVKAGIQSTALSFGLGAGIADVNSDGWPDIFITHDYDVPDYLYINNGNGTFTDQLKESFGHTSHFSMGNDIADINNDGWLDIYSLDMLPADNHRQKVLFPPDNYSAFDLRLRSGFHYQSMRNMLQLNNGDGTYAEIGQLAGISNTDWSWSSLFADYDNDGWKDLMVTNGYVRDYSNLDFVKYAGDHLHKKDEVFRKDLLELVQKMPSSNVVNCAYKNNGNLTFSDESANWGFNLASNSNGAAYADLDNDGDLDLVVNNINQAAFVYRNETDQLDENHYLKVKLIGNGLNTFGLGTKVTIFHQGNRQMIEQMPTRGYLSSVSPILHFGLGDVDTIDSLKVVWLNGQQQVIENVIVDRILTLSIQDSAPSITKQNAETPIFKTTSLPLVYTDPKNPIIDYKRQSLLVNPMSFSGPCMVKGDINHDGLDDIFIGGARGHSASLFVQRKDHSFALIKTTVFEEDKESEDTDALFFDANGDGYTDLYVASGGYHLFNADDPLLQDRLYINDGKGYFTKSPSSLPDMKTSASCVKANDINGDGALDLFVGGRVIPGRYPEAPSSYTLINDGHGNFKNMTATISPELSKIGMVTDAVWIDLNDDDHDELVVVGEWMPVTVFVNEQGSLKESTAAFFEKKYSGWWNKILTGDFNADGQPDFIIGNLGLNTQCKASDQELAELYYSDFDNNGSVDPILTFYIQGKSYPNASRDELLEQLGGKRKLFTTYESYSNATISDIFSQEELNSVGRLSANTFTTTYFQSNANGKYQTKELPIQAQYAPVFAMSILDYDGDGHSDVLLCGNMNQARLRFGQYDANYGVLLKGDSRGDFKYITQKTSGFCLKGDVRSVMEIDGTFLFGINQRELVAYRQQTNID